MMASRIWTGVLLVLTAAASLLAVVLAFQVRDLTDQVRHLRFERNLPQAGDVVPPLRAALLDGDSVDLGRPGAGRRQVWFVFTTTCPMCGASVPGWKAAFARLGGDSTIRALGVSLDSVALTRAYVRAHELPFPVVVLDDPLTIAMCRIPGVPLTMAVDSVGRIGLVRAGVLSAAGADSLAAFLRTGHAPREQVGRE
jgi:peroxiredoxin